MKPHGRQCGQGIPPQLVVHHQARQRRIALHNGLQQRGRVVVKPHGAERLHKRQLVIRTWFRRSRRRNQAAAQQLPTGRNRPLRIRIAPQRRLRLPQHAAHHAHLRLRSRAPHHQLDVVTRPHLPAPGRLPRCRPAQCARQRVRDLVNILRDKRQRLCIQLHHAIRQIIVIDQHQVRLGQAYELGHRCRRRINIHIHPMRAHHRAIHQGIQAHTNPVGAQLACAGGRPTLGHGKPGVPAGLVHLNVGGQFVHAGGLQPLVRPPRQILP